MSTEPINYEAVIEDLEAKKAQLDATITMLRALSGLGTLGITPPNGPSGGGNGGTKIASDAFFGKSIPEAAVIHLGNVRKKLSTQALMDALEAGGLPKSKYNTVYAILRRRESQVGDLINMQGEWGLAAWYPNHVKKVPKKGAASEAATEEDAVEADEEAEIEPAGEMKATA
ncbi:MAG: hypothetical protein ABSA85_05470 [Terracidiphilus sp.]|jgi:hypothetical protein